MNYQYKLKIPTPYSVFNIAFKFSKQLELAPSEAMLVTIIYLADADEIDRNQLFWNTFKNFFNLKNDSFRF